jgi:hypothetical protein
MKLHQGLLTVALPLMFLGVQMSWAQSTDPSELSRVTVEKETHFLAADGTDVVLPVGEFQVGEGGGWLKIIPMGGDKKDVILLEAEVGSHDEEIANPEALLTPGEEADWQHLVLLLPEGKSLEALGTLSGIRPRGSIRLKRAQVKSGLQRLRVKTAGISRNLKVSIQRYQHDTPMLEVQPSTLLFKKLTQAINVPKVELALEPMEGDALVYHPVAGWNGGDKSDAQLSMLMYIKNKESKTLTLQKVEFQYGGKSQAFSVESPGLAIAPNAQKKWQNGREYHQVGQVLYFNSSVPSTIRLNLYFKEFTQPVSMTAKLKPYTKSFALPFKVKDLRTDEYWESASTHGGGSQVFAYDMGVEIPGKGHLLAKKDGTQNGHFRIWGKPIYAMANGVVKGFVNNVPNNPRPCKSKETCVQGKDQAKWEPYEHGGAGNHFYIQHGDVIALYAHMQKGSLNSKLLKKGAVVKKGQVLGLAGNSGSSSAPHLHIHVRKETAIETGPFRPLVFNQGFTIGKKYYATPNSNIQWSSLSNLAIPGKGGDRAWVYPEKHPYCGYPTNWGEVSKHGIPEGAYQAEFDKIATCGYALAWVDGYAVGGKTFFNVIFRKNNGPWVARHNMSGSAYQNEFNKWAKAGYRLTHVDSYLRSGKIYYAAVWEKSSGPSFTAYHGVARNVHQDKFEALSKKGYVPVNVSVVNISGKSLVTALYEKKNVGGFYLKSAMTLSQYKSLFDQYKGKGFKLVYLDGYTEKGQPRLSGIWYKTVPYGSYWAKHHLSASGYQNEYSSYMKGGYSTKVVTGYQDGGHRYEGIWVK